MSLTVTVLFCLPCLFSGLALGIDRYLRDFPETCDDLWRLPRTSSLRS